ncbi:MAG: hypothetical protein Q4C47_03995 [Planctomycetia bacterium]|nr:hypothetical protein [Planctomycetia bacterium]
MAQKPSGDRRGRVAGCVYGCGMALSGWVTLVRTGLVRVAGATWGGVVRFVVVRPDRTTWLNGCAAK